MNLSTERIGVQYNKPFNLFSSLLELPDHSEMIYCMGNDQAQKVLLDMKQQALDEVERQWHLEHLKIIELSKQMED